MKTSSCPLPEPIKAITTTKRPNPLLAALALIFALGACTPRYALPGPDLGPATLEPNLITTTDGARLPLRSWGPTEHPRAVILALHGFNDYGSFIAKPAQHFATANIRTYAIDQRGFGATANTGLWAGVDAYRRDVAQTVVLLRARHPGVPLYLLGESMGGAVVMIALAANPGLVDGAILAAPAVWGRATMPWYQRLALWIGVRTVPAMVLTGRGLDITPSDNTKMLRKLGRDPLVIKGARIDTLAGMVDLMDAALASAPQLNTPTLILYGGKDDIIPDGPTKRMITTLPTDARHRVAIYDGGYHMLLRDLDAHMVWDDVIDWIKNPT